MPDKIVSLSYSAYQSMEYKLEHAEKELAILRESTPILTITKPAWDNLLTCTTYTTSNIDKARPELNRVVDGLVQTIQDKHEELTDLEYNLVTKQHKIQQAEASYCQVVHNTYLLLEKQANNKTLLKYGIGFGLVLTLLTYVASL